jgi:outer membrane protein TolC
MPIDLTTALRLVNDANPTIAIARTRVEESYQRQRQAEVAWLPNLQTGPAYQRHDGLLQRSSGELITVSKWNFYYGGGAVLDFQVADALFLPLVARRLTTAEAAAARVVTDNVQLDVAVTYLDLLQVYGQLAINAEALIYAEKMLSFAQAAERAELGKTPADLTRARTEVNLRRRERIDLETRAAEVSARLAQLLLLRPTVDLRPLDPVIVPIALVPADRPLDELVSIGLTNRPEMAQGQALAAAAEARLRQARVTPFVPRLGVGYSAGDFGGGINDNTQTFRGRGDGTAQAIWELHNLGAGDVAVVRQRRALYNEATLHVTEIQAEVAAQVTAAARAVRAHQRALDTAQTAVRDAEETWQKLLKAAFGMEGRERHYDPLEPLIAEQQVAETRTRYLAEIIDYNKAQFRLYTYLGQPPLCALPQAAALQTQVPVIPPANPVGPPPSLSRPPAPKGVNP